MGSPPQLPAGYQMDEPQGGPPKPPKGYTMDGTPPPAPPDQFAQDTATVNAWAQGHPVLGPAARFLVHGGQTAANMLTGFPSFTYHALTDAPTPGEVTQAPQERFVSRMIGMPQAIEAGQEYAAGHVTPAGAVSVLPEALGEGVGNVTGGAFYGKGTEVAKALPGELNRVIPSTTRAGKGLATLETQYAAHPVEATRFLQEAAKMEDQLGTIGEKLPAPIDFLRSRIQLAQGNAALGIPPDPFAFQEARTAIKQLNSKINFRNPSPSDILYQRAAGALAQDITESTGRPSPVAPEGFQADYQRMLNESRRGNKAIRFAENFGPYAGAFAGYELGHELGAPLGAEFATGYLGRQIGKPIAGAIMRGVIERQGGPPNISVPPTPPSLAMPPAPPTGAPPEPPPTSGRRIASEPVATEQRSGVDRRVDAAARAKFSAMTPEQQYQAAYTNHVTGLPNARAFAEAPPSGAYGFSDVAGLKYLNDTHGMAAGDALLRAKAQALRDVGLEAYHTGGDEFQVRGAPGDTPATISQKLAQANATLGNAIIEFKGPNGEVLRYSGAEFRHGTGATPQAAQQGMMSAKAASKATRGTQGNLVRMPPPTPEGTITTPSAPPAPPMDVRGQKVYDFIGKSIQRAAKEAVGQGVLDDMVDQNISPVDVTRKFWDDTYFKLPAELQAKMRNYLKSETSFQPGDTIGFDRNRQPIIAQDWAHIANTILDVTNDASELEGTTRGLVAYMKVLNDRFANANPRAPRLQGPPAPPR